MADKKISELTALTTPDGAEELVVNDGGTSKKITTTNLIKSSAITNNAISGDKIDGGTISNFTSTGIDDNATSTQVTVTDSVVEFEGTVKAKSSSSGDYVRMYGGSGTGKWDIYGNGANLRISDNEGAGALQVDTNMGLGVTPESSGTLMSSFEFGVGGVLAGYGSTYPNTYLGSNVKFNASGNALYKVTDQAALYTQDSAGIHYFQVAPSGTADTAISWTAAMTILNNGNALFGTANASPAEGVTSGTRIGLNGRSQFSAGSAEVLTVNRFGSDGDIVQFRKNGTTVGTIGVRSGTDPYFVSPEGSGTGMKLNGGINAITPCSTNGSDRDNVVDLGYVSGRFDDIYATNGTIQTSDRNEKQDIEELSEAEQRVAIACKGLMRKFRWQDAVAEKGDDARIHFGIIAQDLQDAFTVEGLDAGRYAMFISTTWYEKQTPVDAVEAVDAVYETVVTTPAAEAQEAVMGERQVMETIETGTYVNLAGETITETSEVGVTEEATETVVEIQTDEDGNRREVEVERTVQVPVMEAYETSPATEAVAEETEERLVSEAVKAKDAYIRTDTEEEPTEGYTERTRLGVRYPELLAFIISAI